jgi:hypothetical protein
MRRLQGPGNLTGNWQRLAERNRAARDTLCEVLSPDELHHQRAIAAPLLEPVDLRNIRMVQRGERLGFAGEPGEPVRVPGDGSGQDLQGDIATELRVMGAKHLSHAAFADLRVDFIRAEASAGGECQAGGLYRRADTRWLN